jgi:hypothetical protein
MSKIEVNQVDPQSGTTLTLGTSGDTVNIPSGVTITNNGTQTGFGRTGTVDWQTGSIKTSTFTAANGEGYFADTTSGGFTMNLPAGSAGAIVSVVDYAGTFDTNALTVSPNGSEKIGGIAADATLSAERQSITLVYIDGTQGWINTQNTEDAETGKAPYSADFLCIAGAGGGGCRGGGSGAGGYRNSFGSETSGGGGSSESSLTFTAGVVYTITVGSGGAGSTNVSTRGTDGPNSSIAGSGITTITSTGGGGGASDAAAAGSGGSGGGGANTGTGASGTANQGFDGGNSNGDANGGGGGAGGAADDVTGSTAGNGGVKLDSSITGSSVSRCGGGGGGHGNDGTSGGGGGGGAGAGSNTTTGGSGTANTGSGAGGGGRNSGVVTNGGNGGSGIVILSVPTASYSGITTGSPTVSTSGSNTVIQFTGDGSYTG